MTVIPPVRRRGHCPKRRAAQVETTVGYFARSVNIVRNFATFGATTNAQ